MSIPIPDSVKPVIIPAPPAETTLGDDKESKGVLEDAEYGFILDTCLREKHRRDSSVIAFIDAFIRCKNISQASAEAGIHPSIGNSYRNRNDISLAIPKLIDKSSVKYGFDASEIVERVKEQVDFDPIELQNPDGTWKSNMHEIAPEARRNIKKFEAKNLYGTTEDMNGVKTNIVTGVLIKVEFYDKQKAIDMISKEKDLFKTTTKVEHTVSNEMASILLESAKRGQQASLEYRKPVDVIGEVVSE